MGEIKGLVFDLDGVITDTAERHYLAWKRIAHRLGIAIDREWNERLKGISRTESLELILAENPTLLLDSVLILVLMEYALRDRWNWYQEIPSD